MDILGRSLSGTVSVVMLSITLMAFPAFGGLHLVSTSSGNAVYDDVQNITWLGHPDVSGVKKSWQDAMDWADGLDYGGHGSWRLPEMALVIGDINVNLSPASCVIHTEAECLTNEFSHMFFENLGGSNDGEIVTSTHPNMTLFPALDEFSYYSNRYWSRTETQNNPATEAWSFSFGDHNNAPNGGNLASFKTDEYFAWAVADGDVFGATAVPEPGTTLPLLALFGAALFSRRKVSA